MDAMTTPMARPVKGDTAENIRSELDASEVSPSSSCKPRDYGEKTSDACSDEASPGIDDQSHILSRIKKLQDELIKTEKLASEAGKLEKIESHWDAQFELFGSDVVQQTWAQIQGKRAQMFVKDTTAFALSREWVHESEDSFIRYLMERQDFDKKLSERRAHWEAKKGISRLPVDESQDPTWSQDGSIRTFPLPSFLDLLGPEAEFNETPAARGYDSQERQLRTQIHEVVRNKYCAFRAWNQQNKPVLEFKEPDPRLNHLWPRPMANYVQWMTFINGSPNKAFFSEERQHLFALDVLDGEPDPNSRIWSDSPVTRRTPSAVPRLAQGHVPERIRLNGPHFPHTFAHVFHSPAFTDHKRLGAQITLLQPYRLLIHHEKDIRDRYEALKEKFAMPGNHEAKSTGSFPQNSEENDPMLNCAGQERHEGLDVVLRPSQMSGMSAQASHQERSTTQDRKAEGHQQESKGESRELSPRRFVDSKTAMDYLGCLIDFMDLTISPRRRYLQGMECRRVNFRDLWYLFNPGDEVIGRDGRQVYRVIKVLNPTHKGSLRNIFSDYDGNEKSRYFHLSCVHVDFDGKQIGPVSTTFMIKMFAGERTVESLEVYPLRLHGHTSISACRNRKNISESSDSRSLRQELIRRGQKFFQAACMKLEHTFYNGPTAVGDEIESQVVVDFETALSSEKIFNEDSIPRIKSLLGDADDCTATSSASGDHAQCSGPCCFEQFVCDDSFVDNGRTQRYVDSLIPKTYAKLPSVAIYPRDLNDTTGDDALTDDEFLIMSYRVFAFVLRTRKWGEFYRSFQFFG